MEDTHAKPLSPECGMPMWFYRCKRNFRYPVPTDFEFAYIDRAGNLAITGPFSIAFDFGKDAAVVGLDRYTMTDDGIWKLEGNTFRSTRSAVLLPDGTVNRLPGRVDSPGCTDDLVVVEYDAVAPGEDYAVRVYDLADKSGALVTSHKWTYTKDYSEGLAVVHERVRRADATGAKMLPEVELWGYRDRQNKSVIPPRFVEAERFSEGLAVVSERDHSAESCDGKDLRFYHPFEYFYVDKFGKEAIKGPFMEARPFVNGLAAVMLAGKWGYIDKSGKVVVPCVYDFAGDFSGRLAPVEKDMMVGFIDETGKQVIPFKYRDAREFSSRQLPFSLAPATIDGRRWGYVDESGEFKIEPKFQRAFPFHGERALVFMDIRKELKPSQSEAHYFYRAAQIARDEGNINQSRAMCRSIVDTAHGAMWGEPAEKLLSNALPDHDLSQEVLSLYREGMLLALSGKLAEAEQHYRKAAKLDPGFFSSYGALAYVLTEQKRYDEAAKLLKTTLAKFPNYARGYWRLSLLHKAQGHEALASKNLEKARSIEPDDWYFAD
ncbi:MAG: WG repeat-containing protein [Candidatus Obscuribacter sp.]|nr:WG repeat-containing protein [Candidatus Obscuribacter sp.]